ncbi:MAG TPA: hypothetical protein VGN23_10810 [Verrucomicrobiae bacterium]|jgi:hypothetical protein
MTGQFVTAQPLLGAEHNPAKIFTTPTNYLQPCLLITRNGLDWNVEIDYIAKTNFTRHAWLKPITLTGSKLKIWSKNGAEIVSTNIALSEATHLPNQTTTSNIISSVRPSDRRGLQWLWTQPEMLSGANSFYLRPLFGNVFTNDILLQVTPLLYKVETNNTTADLVEFPPIKVKLMTNGDVQKTN